MNQTTATNAIEALLTGLAGLALIGFMIVSSLIGQAVKISRSIRNR
jgi:hypothetical protein